MIIAKAIIPKQFWILKNDENRKVGNIEANSDGYSVRLNNSITTFKTLDMLRERISIDFEQEQRREPQVKKEIYGYATSTIPHNAIWDLKRKLPLYTTTPRSRSWMAAGWYRMRYNNIWRTVFCPKVILLDRYDYHGPFSSKERADQA